MKYLKTQEDFWSHLKEWLKAEDSDIKVGDYVLVGNPHEWRDGVDTFLSNNIGYVYEIRGGTEYVKPYYLVQYHGDTNLYDKVEKYRQHFTYHGPNGNRLYSAKKIEREEITEFAKTKEELEMKLAANKYNLWDT